MKKLIFSSLLVLFAVIAFSTKANAQSFQVINNAPIAYQVDYCAMSSGTVAGSGGTFSTTSTCTISLPCTLTLSFPGTACAPVIVALSPCPTLGIDYVTNTHVITGCSADPRVTVNFYYNGGTNDIIITLN